MKLLKGTRLHGADNEPFDPVILQNFLGPEKLQHLLTDTVHLLPDTKVSAKLSSALLSATWSVAHTHTHYRVMGKAWSSVMLSQRHSVCSKFNLLLPDGTCPKKYL